MPRPNRRRRSQDSGESGSSWLQTYGDMITLLLAFFVLLYSISTIDAVKFERMMVSIHESFSGVLPERQAQMPREDPEIRLPDPSDREVPDEEELRMEEIYEELADYIEEADLEDIVLLEMEERGVVMRFQDKILFDPGEADLKQEGYEVLDDIAAILATVPNEITIEGFTDDVPQNTPEFPSNWELSTGRATTVLRFLAEEAGIEAERLSATGYGEYRPIVPNDSPENRQLNRRVDITLLWSTWEKGDLMDRDTVDLDEVESHEDLEDLEGGGDQDGGE